MQKIFIGMILILLDFNVNIGASKLDLLPDFIGYICMVKGMTEMIPESFCFEKARPVGIIMGIYFGVVFFLDLIGASAGFNFLAVPSAIVTTVLFLYITYLICQAVLDIEGNKKTDIGGEGLMKTWKLLAVFDGITTLLVLVGLLGSVGILLIIVDFIVYIVFLVCFKNVKNEYYMLR